MAKETKNTKVTNSTKVINGAKVISSAQAKRLAKLYILLMPMPSSLHKKFRKCGRNYLLEGVYERTAKLIENNPGDKAFRRHLRQILPCIAFYEALKEDSESKEDALEIYGKWSLLKVEKLAKCAQVIMKIPGLYKLVPKIFNKMLGGMFGEKAGFKSKNVSLNDGFAVEMTVCPYVKVCRKYNCFEIVQFFCKADDICYGNLHPQLSWERTETLGTGGECCDFKIRFKEI